MIRAPRNSIYYVCNYTFLKDFIVKISPIVENKVIRLMSRDWALTRHTDKQNEMFKMTNKFAV